MIRSSRLRSVMAACAAALAMLIAAGVSQAQQVADTTFAPPLGTPSFAQGSGPVVLIDEGHHNFHTMDGRYRAFARLVGRDGFGVRPHRGRFRQESLAGARVLVIANALGARNEEAWYLPIDPAFDSSEVATVREWVRDGGSLLLIADHMPFPGAAENLAAAFGIRFQNGFAQDAAGEMEYRLRRGPGLKEHAVTNGRSAAERVDSAYVFTGQAFRSDAPVDTVLALGPGAEVLLPLSAWEFSPLTPRVSAAGAMQGATLRFGRGRVAVFGEAAMFTAQLAGPRRTPMGMNDPRAPQNARLAINTVRWLAGVLPERAAGATSPR